MCLTGTGISQRAKDPYAITHHPICTGIVAMLAAPALLSGGSGACATVPSSLVFVRGRISTRS